MSIVYTVIVIPTMYFITQLSNKYTQTLQIPYLGLILYIDINYCLDSTWLCYDS